MSYSRWSTSTWYTFWTAMSPKTIYKWPTKELKNKQTFEICDYPPYHITYGELKEKGAIKVLKEVEEYYSKSYPTKLFIDFDADGNAIYEDTTTVPKNPTKHDLSELAYYLQQFIEDVDDHFKLGNFLLYEWYYPIRNNIILKIKSFFRSLRKES